LVRHFQTFGLVHRWVPVRGWFHIACGYSAIIARPLRRCNNSLQVCFSSVKEWGLSVQEQPDQQEQSS
jgi:hypothetical protein